MTARTAAGAHGQYQVPARPSGADSDYQRLLWARQGQGGRTESTRSTENKGDSAWPSAAQRLLSHVGRCLHHQLSAAPPRAPSRDRVGTLEPWACLDLDRSVEELQRGALGGTGG